MTGHTPTISAPEPKSPTQTFFSWLGSHTYLFIGHSVTIISSAVLIFSLVYYSFHTEHLLGKFITPSRVQAIIYWAHIVFIIFCIVYLLWIINLNGVEKDRVKKARDVIYGGEVRPNGMTLQRSQQLLREFKIYFILFWISMFALYVAFIIGAQKGKDSKGEYVATISPHSNMLGDVSRVGSMGNDEKSAGYVPINVAQFTIDVTPVQSNNGASHLKKESSAPVTEQRTDHSERYVATFSVRKSAAGDSGHEEGAESEEKPERDVVVSVSDFKLDVMPVDAEKQAPHVGIEKPTPLTKDAPPAARFEQVRPFTTSSWDDAFKHMLSEFLPFALNTTSLLFVFWCLSILYLPYRTNKEKLRQRRLLYLSSFVVVLIISSYPLLLNLARMNGEFTQESLLEYMTAFNAVSGTLNAVVLALLIARLDSKLIGLPSWLVSVLYLYAAVQPLFVVFSQPGLMNEIIKTFVLLFVFILKVYFFLIIIYAMQTGRMLNYLFCFPTLNQRVKAMFDNHFEIVIKRKDSDSYYFSIMKNHSTAYKAHHVFPSEEACITEINRIQNLMAHRHSYNTNPFGGLYIVEIKEGQNLYCSSPAQRSSDAARELITESMDYIPHCGLKPSE